MKESNFQEAYDIYIDKLVETDSELFATKQFRLAIKCALELGKIDSAKDLLVIAAERGLNPSRIEEIFSDIKLKLSDDDELRELDYNALKASSSFYGKTLNCGLADFFYHTVSDQSARWSFVKKHLTQDGLSYVDSVNAKYAADLINKVENDDDCFAYLFPRDGLGFLVIVTHAIQADSTQLGYWEGKLKSLLVKGYITPKDYALVIEGYYSRHNGCFVYGNFNSRRGVFSKLCDIKNVDSLRKEIGLSRLIDYSKRFPEIELPPEYEPMSWSEFYECN